MAIENTVAGTIIPNCALLESSNLTIIGEVYLRIRQNLLALPGQRIGDMREVHSHPMAIQQCQSYFENHPHIRLVESTDTAASAAWISENKFTGFGAIAGQRAAELYGLDILAAGIETDERNFTRFLVLARQAGVHEADPDKASLVFHIPHKRGSLALLLTLLSDNGCNLTKIQSLPIIGREWEYSMHVDVEFDRYEDFRRALAAITPHVNTLKVLGEYHRGRKDV